MLEKIQRDFDENGTPSELSVVVAPGMRDQVERVLQQLQLDPATKLRHDEILEKQRGEWRDREAARKLVG